MSFNEKLDHVASNSLYVTMANATMIEYCFKVFKRFLKKGSILEMGPAEGLMTDKLILCSDDLTVVEGSVVFAENLKAKYSQIKIENCLFENFNPLRRFDNIVLGHVLEHVEDPVKVLELCRQWLADDGVILAAVPNAHSIHRQAAVIMGLQEKETSMSDLDRHHGHLRIYDPFSLRADFKKADLSIFHYGGYWLKPVSNRQIHDSWSREMLLAFMELGERYPDISAEIYVVAGK